MFKNFRNAIISVSAALFSLSTLTPSSFGMEDDGSFLPKPRFQNTNKENESQPAFTPKRASKLCVFNAALFHDAEEFRQPTKKKTKLLTAEEVNLDVLTPRKLNTCKEAGVSTPELREGIAQVKRRHPNKIQDTDRFQPSHQVFYSPVAPLVLSRTETLEARKGSHIVSLPATAFIKAEMVESPEERRARKEKQMAEFEAAEAARGISIVHLEEENQTALQPWLGFFKYIDFKKERITLGSDKKMKWPDIADAFSKFVAPHMSRHQIDGYEIYYLLKTVDFNRVNPLNQHPNYINMMHGGCPVGSDNDSMEWHHVTRFDKSHKIKIDEPTLLAYEGPLKIILIPAWIHQQYRQLHLGRSFYKKPRTKMDRSYFGEYRELFNQHIVKTHYTIN